MQVRDATEDDAGACAAIYAPYVTDTAITFEYDPPSAA
jgi:L-amino acid N-acyltransferase YncA